MARAAAALLLACVTATSGAGPAEPPGRPPNILVWVIDDAGFADIGAFGGPVETPTLDGLAAAGLRYTNFHATAVCSSTRASLLTGRNHHAVAMGAHALGPADQPGYRARIPKSAATIARVLQLGGYATFALGKWDHLPPEEMSPAGPFDLWPSGQGFDRFYGFLGAASDQFRPLLYAHHEPVDPAAGRPDYHLSTDMADHAIGWIRQLRSVQPEKPFFMYFATGAVHSPHQAPPAWLAKYRGRFDAGWDELRRRILLRQKQLGIVPDTALLPDKPAAIADWESLDPLARGAHARAMEAYAAQLDHADHEFGRVVAELSARHELDDTIVVVLSDNGASAEGGPHGQHNITRYPNGLASDLAENLRHLDGWGGPDSYPQYAVGWAAVSNTPFRLFKQTVHEGGVRVPLIVAWPRGIGRAGEVRAQFHHVNDLMPTLLSMVGVALPATVDGVGQQRVDGIDMTYTFADAAAPGRKPPQYFEMFGNRGIWAQDWKAVTAHNPAPWILSAPGSVSDDHWELYDLRADFNEREDLARRRPQKLEELRALFGAEAERNQVFPLLPDRLQHMRALGERFRSERQGRFEYQPAPGGRIPELLAPPVKNAAHRIIAEFTLPVGCAGGVLVAAGGSAGGYALYVRDGAVVYAYNFFSENVTRIVAAAAVAPGRNVVELQYRPGDGSGGMVTLRANGHQVAAGEIPRTIPRLYSLTEPFDIGDDTGTPVDPAYAAAPRFAGELERVTVLMD